MKRVLSVLILFLSGFYGVSQTPQQFKYQAVLKDASGIVMANQTADIFVEILKSDLVSVVFSENHTVTTSPQGVINLNIGEISDLSVVDWKSDTYFIQISVNGIVMGMSQLLSVPYALSAKTVENIDYEQINNKPSIPADVADLTDNTSLLFDGNWNELNGIPPDLGIFSNEAGYLTDYVEIDGSVTNEIQTLAINGNELSISGDGGNTVTLPYSDGSPTVINAGENVTISGYGTFEEPYVINAEINGLTHYIGEFFAGGIVFYIDDTGNHGLICSPTDVGFNMNWSNVIDVAVGGYTTSDWNGAAATDAIVAQSGHTISAALSCLNYLNPDFGYGEYSDWYLPAIDELNLLFTLRYTINKVVESDVSSDTQPILKQIYWTSSESSSNNAWYVNFISGQSLYIAKNNGGRVRAVREF